MDILFASVALLGKFMNHGKWIKSVTRLINNKIILFLMSSLGGFVFIVIFYIINKKSAKFKLEIKKGSQNFWNIQGFEAWRI